jgi:hypothetical protein
MRDEPRFTQAPHALLRLLCALALPLALAACLGAPSRGGAVPRESSRTERVLFVGNSITYRNDLPAHFAAVATAMRDAPVEAAMIAGSGEHIDQHAARGIVQHELASGRYTALVLQEFGRGLVCDDQVAQMGFDCAASHAAHRALSSAARAQGMRVVLLGSYSMFDDDASALESAERELAASIGAAHVGFGDVPTLRARMPARLWLDADNAHPGLDLTLLMALRTSAVLYGDRALPVPFEISFRDYRGDATPKPDASASRQAIAPLLQRRRIEVADTQALPIDREHGAWESH